MSSGFVTETELEEQRKLRQADWERVRTAEQPLDAPEPEYDPRSLYERLKEQKDKKDDEWEESRKLKNLVRGLDDDEVGFLDLVDKSKMEEESRRQKEEREALEEYRRAVASMAEQAVDERVKAELKKPLDAKQVVASRDKFASIGAQKKSQGQLLAGVIKRKNSEEHPRDTKRRTSSVSETESEDPNNSFNLEKDKSQSTASPELLSPLPKPALITVVHHPSALECVAILPGIGNYETSDSDNSSDSSDVKLDTRVKFDLCGRPIPKKCGDSD